MAGALRLEFYDSSHNNQAMKKAVQKLLILHHHPHVNFI